MNYYSQAKKRPKTPPAFESGVISEPLLSFGGHHEHIDPKTGLSLYGPYTAISQKNQHWRILKSVLLVHRQ